MRKSDVLTDTFLLWRSYLARVVSRIVPPHDIEDIVQETYVRVCQFNTKEKIRSPGMFMTRVARNLALDHIKRADVLMRSPLDEENEMEFDGNRSSVDETFHQVASREEFAYFCEAVRSLPLQCRRVFVLRKVYQYSQREIAKELGLSESTVEKHVAEGARRCTQFMRQYLETDKQVLRNQNTVSQVRRR